jgi:hypothetical protein
VRTDKNLKWRESKENQECKVYHIWNQKREDKIMKKLKCYQIHLKKRKQIIKKKNKVKID